MICSKKIAAIIAFLMTACYSFAQEATPEESKNYKIRSVEFNSQDKTKVSALKKNIADINYEKIFATKAEFETYLEEIKQELINTRTLENISYNYSAEYNSESDTTPADVTYTFSDSTSILVFPKPSFDSNSGIEVKLKLKDTNFLGLLNTLDADFNINLGNEDAPTDFSKVTTGINYAYDYPFDIGITQNSWNNDFTFNWTIGSDSPEFSYDTGITVGIPFKHNKINFSLTQSVVKENDYAQYGDSLYFTEKAAVSMPLTLGYLGNTTEVSYTPTIQILQRWDKDGINEDNKDLRQTPFLQLSQTISVSKIDWRNDNSFRNGYSLSTTQTIGWDFHSTSVDDIVVPTVEGTAQFFKGWKYAGIAARATFYAGTNSNTKIGGKLRGALDNQTFAESITPVDADNYALETPTAVVFNIDVPVHIITTHWLDWSRALFGPYEEKSKFVQTLAYVPRKLFKYLDFELQLNPFMDIALLKNRGTDTFYDYKEGIYTAGLEVLVYPLKWRSFVVRMSLGTDIGSKVLDGKFGIDNSWRNPSSLTEIYFGLGLQF